MSALTQQNTQSLFDYKEGKLFWKNSQAHGKVKAGDEAGCLTSKGYHRLMIGYKEYPTHRVVFLYHHGYLPKMVDHIDGNRKNNAIENLRPATNALNCLNKSVQSNNKLGIKNVCWSNQNKKWFVQVSVKGKRVVSKFFDDLDLADLVATMAREKYHGAFANHGLKGAM